MASGLKLSRRALLGSGMAVISFPLAAQARPPYRNPAAPVELRVRDLLSRMTLEEKAAQLRCAWNGKAAFLNEDGSFSPEKAAAAMPDGLGQIARPSDWAGTGKYPKDWYRDIPSTIRLVNAIQRYHVENTRLGIPALFHEEAAHGFMASDATIFPIPPGLGSTWDPDLVERAFVVTAREARLRGATVALAPVLDLARELRFGRIEEFYGEDPYHVSEMGKAAVRGLQGRSRPLGPDRIFATLKHFIHGAPQGGLNIGPSDMSERLLREAYLVPFARVVADADPAIIMPSYNEVGGIPSHGNVQLLQRTGRDLLGFKGAYFSDYGGIGNLSSTHHMAATREDAAVMGMRAGVDVELPDGQAYAGLPKLVREGRVPLRRLDEAVGRVLALKFEAGLFERPYSDLGAVIRGTATAGDAALARKVAAKSIVLLKNDGILPLDASRPLRLAVIGPNAKEPLFGGYSGITKRGVGILAGVQAAAGKSVSVTYAEGVRLLKSGGMFQPPVFEDAASNDARIAEAVAAARAADMILLVIGDSADVTREAIGRDAPGDRRTLGLIGDQDRLVEAMAATGKPVVTLLLSGRPLAAVRAAEVSRALVHGWYLGQEGGNAFADILFGRENPGGKMPVTVPRDVGDLPVFYNRHPSAGIRRYVEGRAEPLYPFGHGLSYTSFDISAPRLASSAIRPGETAKIDVDVTNTGAREGDEVVQIYIRDEVSSAPRPILELKAFRRVTLKPAERRVVRFELTPDDLAFWDIDMRWSVEPGTFTISAGSSSAALKTASLEVLPA